MPYKLGEEQIKTASENSALGTYHYCRQWNIHHTVTGVSGGLDSAVVLAIIQRASQIAQENNYSLTSIGTIMPCESDPEDEELGRLTIERFGAEMIRFDLTDVFRFITGGINFVEYFRKIKEASYSDRMYIQKIMEDPFILNILNNPPDFFMASIDDQLKEILKRTGGEKALEEWDNSGRVTQGNIKARLRMICNYHIARRSNGIVLSTDNLSEYLMGFWTLGGDVGDFGPIQNVWKGLELYDIARYYDVPERITGRKPNDGLKVGGSDEEQLGADYPIIDPVMIKLIQDGFDPNGSVKQLQNLPEIEGVAQKLVYKLAKRCLYSQYKRERPAALSRKVLGLVPSKDIKI